jgi:hypothetical protein
MVNRAVQYLLEGGSQTLAAFFDHTTVRDTVTAFVTRRVQPGSATALLLGALFFLFGWTNMNRRSTRV